MTEARNRAVIINGEDYNNLEFMLWLFDIRVMKHLTNVGFTRDMGGFQKVMYRDLVLFRCSDEKYNSIYEKMDSLGIWKGECINPRIEGDMLYVDKENILIEDMTKRYLIVGV